MLPSPNGASTANAARASASGVCALRPRSIGRPARAAVMSTAVIMALSSVAAARSRAPVNSPQ